MEIKIFDNNKEWYYKIKLCDEKLTINKFLQKFNFDIDEFNALNPDMKKLQAGKILKMPKSSQYFHIVQPLETYSSLSLKYNIPESKLKEINKTNVLFIGQKIFIWYYKIMCYNLFEEKYG